MLHVEIKHATPEAKAAMGDKVSLLAAHHWIDGEPAVTVICNEAVYATQPPETRDILWNDLMYRTRQHFDGDGQRLAEVIHLHLVEARGTYERAAVRNR